MIPSKGRPADLASRAKQAILDYFRLATPPAGLEMKFNAKGEIKCDISSVMSWREDGRQMYIGINDPTFAAALDRAPGLRAEIMQMEEDLKTALKNEIELKSAKTPKEKKEIEYAQKMESNLKAELKYQQIKQAHLAHLDDIEKKKQAEASLASGPEEKNLSPLLCNPR